MSDSKKIRGEHEDYEEHEEHVDVDGSLLAKIRNIPLSQSRYNGRHCCPVCAFQMGVLMGLEAAKNGKEQRLKLDAGLMTDKSPSVAPSS